MHQLLRIRVWSLGAPGLGGPRHRLQRRAVPQLHQQPFSPVGARGQRDASVVGQQHPPLLPQLRAIHDVTATGVHQCHHEGAESQLGFLASCQRLYGHGPCTSGFPVSRDNGALKEVSNWARAHKFTFEKTPKKTFGCIRN